MKRDTVKTVAGLIIIGGIVVATFLYGNSQRQAQLAHDQDVKKQQEAKAKAAAKAAAAPTTTPSSTVVATGGTSNTAPVNTPTSNAIQGQGTTPAPKAPVAAATTPATGGTDLPAAGPEGLGMLGMGTISVMLLAVRRSKQSLLKAARTPR